MLNETVLNLINSKQKVWKISKYFFLALVFFVCSNVKILNSVAPCFYGLFLTIMFLGESPVYLSFAYLCGLFLYEVSIPIISFGVITCIGASFISFIHKKQGKLLSSWLGFVYSLILGLPYLYFNISSIESFYLAFINVFLNSIFMLCSYHFLKIVKTRKLNLNLNVDEVFCGCLVLTMLFCGLQNLNIFSFDLVKFVGFLVILLSTAMLKNSFSVILSIVLGLGASLPAGDLSYLTIFSIAAVFVNVFKNYSKLYSILIVLLVDLVFSLFFVSTKTFSLISIFPVLFAGLIYFLIPNKIINKVKSVLYLKNENDSLKNILNQNKMQVSKKLLYTAEVFYEMDKNFRKLVKGSLDVKNSKLMICNEIIRCNCENCPQRAKCLKGFNRELKNIFEKLVDVGFEKGKVTLVDLPAYLTNRCCRLNQVVNGLNALLTDYKNYSKMLGNLDASKILIAEQLGGISHILTDLSQETKQTVLMDYKTEKLIKETLIYNDIVPSEVVCFEKDEKTNVVSMILRTIDFDNEKITNILNKICSSKMVLEEILPGEESNLTYLSYKTAPTYDIAVGIAQTSKGGQEVCGDCHSASKLVGDKFMFALCDGMGHGEKASKASELSLNMIENFYKAGFDNQTILTSVNKLLNLGREDVFSALDVSVVDLKNGEVDFIKQGATIGFIKRGSELNKIESNSLPLGILEEIKPKVTKTVLTPDDFVIMLSDGVVDAFSEQDLETYLKNLPETNPQALADKILNKAKVQQRNYPDDDMTVLVGKIFYNFG